MTWDGELAPDDPNYPDWRTTERYATHPQPPQVYLDDDAELSRNDENWRGFYARMAREGALRRASLQAQERASVGAAQGLEWVCRPDPLMRLFAEQFRMMNSYWARRKVWIRRQVQLRIKEVAAALQREAQAGTARSEFMQIDLGNIHHRDALAEFLKPIYGCYTTYLRGHSELEYLFSLSHQRNLRELWLLLHNYLMEHGFSETKVQEFIAWQESLNPSPDPPLGLAIEKNVLYSSDREVERVLLDNEQNAAKVLQFSENYTPADLQILDRRMNHEDGMRLASVMGEHKRLGSEASPLVNGRLPNEVRNMIWDKVFHPMNAEEIGYTHARLRRTT